MNPRYLVTYKHYNGQTVGLLTVSIGRFHNQEHAEARARDLFERPGNEITQIRRETGFEDAKHKVVRFCIRSMRIVVSLVVGFGAYVFIYDPNSRIGDIPFSSLTLNMILSGLLRTGLLIGVAFLCWQIAFGNAPED